MGREDDLELRPEIVEECERRLKEVKKNGGMTTEEMRAWVKESRKNRSPWQRFKDWLRRYWY